MSSVSSLPSMINEPADAPAGSESTLIRSANLVCLSFACKTSKVTSLNKSFVESEPIFGVVLPVYAIVCPFFELFRKLPLAPYYQLLF